MRKYEYIKQNNEPIEIDYLADAHDEERDFAPSFWYWCRRYYLDDFVRVHNNPWVCDEYPAYIHGMEADEYWHPLFIELVGSDYVNVYEEKEIKE